MIDWKRPRLEDATTIDDIERHLLPMLFVSNNAAQYEGDADPDLAMLLEEVGELALACVGRHEHEAFTELVQIGGIVLNWLRVLLEQEAEHGDSS